MRLAEGAEIVGMAILPAGVAPEGASDEEDAEAGSSSSQGEEDEAAAGSDAAAAAAGPCLLLVTRQGLGKRTPIAGFTLRASRIGQGMTGCKLNPGDALAAVQVIGVAAGSAAGPESDDESGAADVLLSTQQGQLVRVPISTISIFGRTAKGNRLVRVREGDEVAAATVLSKQ